MAGTLSRNFIRMTSLVLFEDNTRLSKTLAQVFEDSGSIKVAGVYNHCDHWRSILPGLNPDVIIMDIDMPGIGGMQGVKEIREMYPQVKIIMYTVFDDDARIFECLCNGANGYILKNTAPDQLIHIIQEVMRGGAMMSPSVAAKVVNHFQMQRKPSQDFDLTRREQEILQLLVRGYTYNRIASTANISVETVKKHLRNIYTKLHVSCGTEAVAKALRDKIVSLD